MIRINAIRVVDFRLEICKARGRGSSRVISKSNKRNVIATRKNFTENGSRAEFIGSNLFHKGLLFLYINLDEAVRRLLKLELWIRLIELMVC